MKLSEQLEKKMKKSSKIVLDRAEAITLLIEIKRLEDMIVELDPKGV